MMRKIYNLLLLLLLSTTAVYAQDATLVVNVTDASGGPSIGATVLVTQNGSQIAVGVANVKGVATITPLTPGTYDLKVTFVTDIKEVKGVKLSEGINRQDVSFGATDLIGVVIEDKPTVIDDNYGGQEEAPAALTTTRNLSQSMGQIGGVTGIDGGTPSIRGGRTEGNTYVVDGMVIPGGSLGLPPSAYGNVQVYASGVPAEYGDATSGIISITTAGISNQRTSRLELIQSFDGYGYSTAEFFTSGPLVKRLDSVLSTNEKKVYVAKVGYMLAGSINYRKDQDPSAVGVWVVNDDVLDDIRNEPLIPSPQGSGYISKSNFLTKDDMTLQKVKPNTNSFLYNVTGKLDWKVNNNIQFTLGGRANNQYNNQYVYTYSLLNSENNTQYRNQTYAGFARLRHRFPTTPESKLQNLNYLIQFDYTYYQDQRLDPNNGENIFQYGHVGQFDIYQNEYQWRVATLFADDADPDNNVSILGLYQRETPADTLVKFTPSQFNKTSGNYTKQVFDFANGRISNLGTILQNGGLINGQTPDNIYSLWSDVGTPFTGFIRNSQDQASLQLKIGGSVGAHNLKMGFRYESRTFRAYSLGAAGLWPTMRQSVNRHLSYNTEDIDSGAIFVFSDGEYRGYEVHKAQGVFLDTVKFERQDGLVQTELDRNLRNYLIENGYRDVYGRRITEDSYLNPDAYDPSIFNIGWFSAQELLENSAVSYYGYDYTGKKATSTPSIDDYLNDEKNRPIAPYNPIYMAWYLQDEVVFKDLSLRMGVRVDRFDANQFVLDDEYSLFPIRTVSEVKAMDGSILDEVTLPSNIGEEFKVYVDDPYNPNNVVGYRNGAEWYDAEGNRINDPGALAELSNSGTIAPFTQFASKNEQNDIGITKETFRDYEPQWTVMPRIAVSFPISEEAMFFANYDVLAQRPTSGNLASINTYYFMQQNATGTIGNPNLRPEKTISYEVGFQQRVAANMSIKVQAFYRELRDMIQVVPVRYAYPIDYTTYGNIDFGTTKGLIVSYDLVPYGENKNFTLNANYTLMYARATGSGSGSQAALVQAGLPNLRTIQPTGSDIRHKLAATLGFNYGMYNPDQFKNRYNGPMWKGLPVLQNAGAQLIFNATSGRPYSGQTNPTQTVASGVAQRAALDGSINGNRYPWIVRMDLRVDKTFPIPIGIQTNDEGKVIGVKHMVGVNAYVWVQNLLDTRNVIGVYRYTGLPNDDGWLSSAEGQQVSIAQAYNEQSYIDMYDIKVNNPSNFSLPRLVRFGLAFNF
ncbi:MAG: TonB-dependent receptor [Bacteroidetes bacterium]|nr:TonB-dependent receptor [Bacteroidota bacterium]